MAELYRLIILKALSDSSFPSGRDGIYFGENGSYNMIDACKAFSQALFDAGKSGSPEPEAFSEEDLKDIGFVSSPSTMLQAWAEDASIAGQIFRGLLSMPRGPWPGSRLEAYARDGRLSR